MKVLVGEVEVELKRLLGKTQKQLMIISPFVTGVAVDILRPAAEGGRVACKLITRLNLNDFRSGVSDLGALKQLVEMGVEVRTLKRLHAKVYVFDDREAVVTSANFTGVVSPMNTNGASWSAETSASRSSRRPMRCGTGSG